MREYELATFPSLLTIDSELEAGEGFPGQLIDQRIDVFAQYALRRMMRADGDAGKDANDMLAAVKRGELAGIYKEDERVPALRARRLNLGWWQLIPRGEDAALVLDPAALMTGPPLIVFRDSVRSIPARLDPALRKAWASNVALRTNQLGRCSTGNAPPQAEAFAAGTGSPVANVVPPLLCQIRRRTARLTLRIDAPPRNQRLFIEPGVFPNVAPRMPTVTVRGTVLVNGRPSTTALISWDFEISGTYRRRAAAGVVSEPYAYRMGRIVTTSGRQDSVDLAQLQPNLIVGGVLKVTASATVGGATVRGRRQCVILGRNPTRADVEAMIRAMGNQGLCGNDGWALLRIFCLESNHRLIQFTPAGNVLIGRPAGIGIVQRDPVASEWRFPRNRLRTPNNFFPGIYWNWQENVREGIRFFRGPKISVARSDLQNLQRAEARSGRRLPDFCAGVLMRAAIRRYNGGTEYRARPIRRGARSSVYVVSPRTDRPAYVANVLSDPHISDPIPRAFVHITNTVFPRPGDPPCPPC